MKPEISLVVVTLEEPEETARTVRSALENTETPLEVIVVDDHSTKHPFTPGVLPDDPRVTLLQRKKRMGLGQNKNWGAKEARGDTFVMTDAHMRFPPGGLDSLHKQAQELGGVVHGICRGFADDVGTGPSSFQGRGAYLYYDPMNGVNNSWRWRPDLCPQYRPECAARSSCWFNNQRKLTKDDGWCPPVTPEGGTYEVPAMLGACYAFPRDVWEKIDGTWNTFATWGFLEQQWALRCQMLGVKIYLDPRIEVMHKFWASDLKICVECRFRRHTKKGQPVDSAEVCPNCGGEMSQAHCFVRPFRTPDNPWSTNAIGCLYSSFGDDVWNEYIAPALQRVTPKHFAKWFAKLSKNPLVLKRRDWLAERKVVTDEEVFKRLNSRRHQNDERAAAKAEAKGESADEPRCRVMRPVSTDTGKVGSIVPPRGGDTDFEPLLRKALQKLNPKRILEWGPGFSTDMFVHLCPKARVVSIEHDESWSQTQSARFDGKAAIKHIPIGPACRYAYWPRKLQPFDLIFVDGRRRCECLLSARKCLTPKGVVILHDANRVAYVLGRELYETMEESENKRTAILRPKEGAKG